MLTRPDGGLLVVIGDVTGKGVSAAMLVAVLVGAIRNQADYSFDSVSMLTMQASAHQFSDWLLVKTTAQSA